MKFYGGPRILRCLALAGFLTFLWLFLAAGSARAQLFHTSYDSSEPAGILSSVVPTNAPGSIAAGFFYAGSSLDMLLKIGPAGTLAWSKAYSTAGISVARETAAGTFLWIGSDDVGTPPRIAPVVAEVDPTGAVLWAREIRLPLPDWTPGNDAEGRFLESDPKSGGYWVGGDFWRQAVVDGEPWLGKLDKSGHLLWAKVLDFPEKALFHSLLPAVDGGIIGVGEIWSANSSGNSQPWMLAVKLGADGCFEWGFRYRVRNVLQFRSWQRLMDVDRHPSSLSPQAAVVGTVSDFCKESTSCDSVAFMATLDETTGDLSSSFALFSTVKPSTEGTTIVADQVRSDVYAIGGKISGNTSGSHEGLLAFVFPHGGVRNAMAYGDGAGPYDSVVESLERDVHTPDPGYLFVLNERDLSGARAFFRPNVVRTNLTGSSGSCECETPVTTLEAPLDKVPVQPVLRYGWPEKAEIEEYSVQLLEKPCRTAVCQAGGPAPQVPDAGKAGAPEAAPVLPGIPGAPEGRRWSMPLRVLPPPSGVRATLPP